MGRQRLGQNVDDLVVLILDSENFNARNRTEVVRLTTRSGVEGRLTESNPDAIGIRARYFGRELSQVRVCVVESFSHSTAIVARWLELPSLQTHSSAPFFQAHT